MGVAHSTLGGSSLHEPRGKSPTPLDLAFNTGNAYRIRWDYDGNGNYRDVFDITTSTGALLVTIGNTTDTFNWRLANGYVELAEISAPGTPDAGFGRIYPKTDGKLYFKNDAGTESDLTGAGGGGGVTYTQKTGNYTAAAGDLVGCGTDTAAFTVTLPASPSANDVVVIKDEDGNAGTNNITVDPNGNKIDQSTANRTETVGFFNLWLQFDGTDNWLIL